MTRATEETARPKNEATAQEDRPWALKSLPPFPSVALKLLSTLEDTEVPMKEIVELLRVDPALSAEILRVSNSALYGLSRQIDNLSYAVVVLGTDVVKRLTLTVALGRFSRNFLHYQSLRICWDHSVACALIAEELAAAMGEPKDRAYTAGLLHDVGRLALLTCYPEEYEKLLATTQENDSDELERERELFEIDHCAAGEWLAQHWNLPSEFVESIGRHYSAKANDNSLVSIVAAANAVADAIGFQVMDTAPHPTVGEIISKLPLKDHAAITAELENFGGKIRKAVSAVTPPPAKG